MIRAPAPDTVPVRPSCVPVATLMAPSCVKEILRVVLKLAVVASEPPAIATPVLAAPRLLSAETDSVPN
ncbi:hypothetical protein D3C87_1697570 [compost metagenome]